MSMSEPVEGYGQCYSGVIRLLKVTMKKLTFVVIKRDLRFRWNKFWPISIHRARVGQPSLAFVLSPLVVGAVCD